MAWTWIAIAILYLLVIFSFCFTVIFGFAVLTVCERRRSRQQNLQN